jgi:serine/threonine protein kinase
MEDFKQGTRIPLKIGGETIVKKKLGEGGQGAVYLVEYEGKEFALKWYIKMPESKFLKNLENNISKGRPNDAFLWPELLAGPYKGSYGYIMALRPSEYRDFSEFLLAKVRFKSVSVMLAAAMNICEAFEELHRKGYNYQDLNDGNFFINPQTGKVLICDNDNVSEYGHNSGIAGKSRYMAPEVVRGEKAPDKWTDLFSLSITLFLLFFNNHPLEGVLTVVPCMIEELERKLYGKNPVFIWDAKDASNRPVRGIHNNVIKRWPLFPAVLKDSFLRAFSKETMTVTAERQTRVMETEWKKVFTAMRNTLVACPYCKNETFIDLSGTESKCLECNRSIPKPNVLQVGKEQIVLMNGMKLYASSTQDNGSYNTVSGEVVMLDGPSQSGLKNLSKDVWVGVTRNGALKNVEPGQVIPALKGIKITFKGGKQAEII